MMIKKLFLFCLVVVSLYSCKKAVIETKICLHDSSIDYLKRWAAVLVETDTYSSNGAITKKSFAYPNGYFQINSDFTYNLYSDDAPVNGKWNINSNCQFVLNPNTISEQDFSVLKLSDDSLVISQRSGQIGVTRHYAAFTCPSLASIEFRWDNAFTLQASYKADSVSAPIYLRAAGYFRLNPDASYNMYYTSTVNGSDMTSPSVNGTWGIAQPGCLLILDKNKPTQTSYDVQKLTADSLVIWRKDTVAKKNFLQHYSKHK